MTTKEEARHLKEWVASKHGGALQCPVCAATGHENWEAGSLKTPAEELGGEHFLYELSCQNCGYTLLFSGQVVGYPSG